MELEPFVNTTRHLKRKYDNSQRVRLTNNDALTTLQKHARNKIQLRNKNVNKRRVKQRLNYPKDGDLVYVKKSPPFCDGSRFSAGTVGRKCRTREHCAELCCGRGYNKLSVSVTSRCNCIVVWCCEVRCEECTQTVERRECK